MERLGAAGLADDNLRGRVADGTFVLMLHSEARLTVVPSSSTGWKMATGEMVDAAHDHSTSFNIVSADSSCHLKANPARVA